MTTVVIETALVVTPAVAVVGSQVDVLFIWVIFVRLAVATASRSALDGIDDVIGGKRGRR